MMIRTCLGTLCKVVNCLGENLWPLLFLGGVLQFYLLLILKFYFQLKKFGLDSTMVKDDDGIENDDVDVKTCMLETLS